MEEASKFLIPCCEHPRSRVLDSHRAHIPRTRWGHCRSLTYSFPINPPFKDSGSCLGFYILASRSNLPATTCKGGGPGSLKASLACLLLLLLLLLLWTKEVQNHESLVQDRKTKKLKSSGWQLIRQKFVTIFDPQKQNLFQQHPSIQFPFICFSSSSSSSCSPRLVVVVVVVPVCLSVCRTD